MIPVLNLALRIADAGGNITSHFHRWLRDFANAISSTYVADQTPQQNIVIADGQFGLHGKRLTINSGIRLIVTGSGRLVICG